MTDDVDVAVAAPRIMRSVLLVGLGLAAGLLLAYVLSGVDRTDGSAAADAGPLLELLGDDTTGVDSAPVQAGDGLEGGPVSAALVDDGDARAVAEVFLTGEVTGDHATSWANLASADAERYDSVARWTAEHARFLPLTGFRIDEVLADGPGAATVVAAVRLTSTLDETLGLVPARALLELAMLEEADGWRVDWTASRFEARYPDDALARQAADEWLTAAVACEQRPEYPGGLFGDPALAEQLCGVTAPIELADATAADPGDLDTSLLASFGSDAAGWARVVRATGAATLDVLLAPVDDSWIVVGVSPTRGS